MNNQKNEISFDFAPDVKIGRFNSLAKFKKMGV